tara:strand:- start:25206 stop:25430 length:225 start_codon:yes stop_codon:yes gene_type:complete
MGGIVAELGPDYLVQLERNLVFRRSYLQSELQRAQAALVDPFVSLIIVINLYYSILSEEFGVDRIIGIWIMKYV